MNLREASRPSNKTCEKGYCRKLKIKLTKLSTPVSLMLWNAFEKICHVYFCKRIRSSMMKTKFQFSHFGWENIQTYWGNSFIHSVASVLNSEKRTRQACCVVIKKKGHHISECERKGRKIHFVNYFIYDVFLSLFFAGKEWIRETRRGLIIKEAIFCLKSSFK